MSQIQIDINALITSDYTKISEIRAAIKLIRDVTAREAVSKHWDWATQVMAYDKEIT